MSWNSDSENGYSEGGSILGGAAVTTIGIAVLPSTSGNLVQYINITAVVLSLLVALTAIARVIIRRRYDS